MKTSIPAAFVLAPLSAALLALGVLLLPGIGAQPATAAPKDSEACVPKHGGNPAACKELIQLEVRDVIPLVEAQTHAVVLTTKDGDMVLPIFVDESAAVAIAFRLAHLRPPQPLSQDLLGSVVTELGAKVTEVRIDDLRDDIYTGRIFLEQGKRKVTLDARPSDSIAMALDGEARIMVTRKVLDEAGITREEIDSLRESGPGVGGSGEPDEHLMDEPMPMDPHQGLPPPGLAPKLAPDKTDEISL
ncbi:bifunctional nuclease family protein [Archangium lansingense]|uniref:Bifunctional nuclease family protein n=1 Tax=Archangium lansingense TaxID=2995310 RepID=A0ABT4AAE3_9BACT|nr:bifunctional nuclease family protein [Archangium lansinium]MCY1078630.1 bifunctional nuclease family protein [Archangium lansinium]